MATGGVTRWELQVAWDRTAYVDESASLMADEGKAVTITRGATDWQTQPGVMSWTWDNSSGRYTSDNPLSPLYGEDLDGAFTLFRIFRGATEYIRHWGRSSVAVPQLDRPGDATSMVVPAQSVDTLGRCAGTVMRAEFVERWVASARVDWVDILPVDDGADVPRALRNLGNREAVGTVVPSLLRLGSASTVQPDGIALDKAIQVEQSIGAGPVIVVTLGPAGAPYDIVIPFRTADRIKAGKSARYIAQGLNALGGEEWSLRLVDNAGVTDLRFFDSAGGSGLVLGQFAEVGDAALGDDQWYALEVFITGGQQQQRLVRVVDQVQVYTAISTGYLATSTRTIVLGGSLAGLAAGAQQACTTTTYGPVAVNHSSTVGHIGYLSPTATEPAQTRVADYRFYAGLQPTTTQGTRSRTVALAPTTGRTILDGLAELATTTGGVVVASRTVTQALLHRDSDAVRLPAVAVTIGVETDAGTDLPWAKVSLPSWVTAAYPGGAVLYVDPTRARIDESVQTCAAGESDARDVASWVAHAGRRLRLTSITVDLAGASNDLWDAMMALEIGDRVRVVLGVAGSVLVNQVGWTHVDCFVTGWTERYARDVAEFDLLLTPADDPVEGAWDDADRGRWTADGTMTVTGGTAVGTTGTGTIVVATTGGAPTWSTSAADYPLDVDWHGERCTVTSAPGGSGSPQTLTITARGVAPSVARVHSTGEPVDIWTGAAWTI